MQRHLPAFRFVAAIAHAVTAAGATIAISVAGGTPSFASERNADAPGRAELSAPGGAFGAPADTAVLDVRIEGTRRSILLRDRSGRILRDLPTAGPWPSPGTLPVAGPSQRPEPVRYIRIIGGTTAFGADGAPDDDTSLPGAYDAGQDPYVQYPELLDPDYQPSAP
jgi:hypothetical protein